MATKYFCDKCDKSSDKAKDFLGVTVPVIQHYNRYNALSELPEKIFDLCENCLIRLNEFLKPDPKQEPNR